MRSSAALAALLVLAPVLVLASVAAVSLQRRDLTDSVFLVADEQAQTVASGVGSAPATIDPMLGGEETIVQVVRRSGGVVRSSQAIAGQPALAGPPPPEGRTHGTRTVLEEEEKFAVVALDVPGSGSYVVVARSLEVVDQAASSTTRILVIGVPTLLAAVAALSWWLTGRALRPVEAMRARASEITAAGGGARLPETPNASEIGRLATTLNEMLERLDANARTQRRFVADASHELRSPIAAIRTVMEVADPARETDWGGVRDDVLTEAGRLERLVSQLLFLARHDIAADASWPRRVPTEVHPAPLVPLVQAEVARPRRLDIELSANAAPSVRADEAIVTAVIGNLLDNAVRHARSRVSVVIEELDGVASVSVEDDGGGIAPGEAERIFDRFVRLDDSRDRDAGGSGLGLSIARAAAGALGGSLAVGTSSLGGAAFRLSLPIA